MKIGEVYTIEGRKEGRKKFRGSVVKAFPILGTKSTRGGGDDRRALLLTSTSLFRSRRRQSTFSSSSSLSSRFVAATDFYIIYWIASVSRPVFHGVNRDTRDWSCEC